MPTPEEQGTVESPITIAHIAPSVIRESLSVECPVVDVGASTGGSGGGGKGDPIEPFQDD